MASKRKPARVVPLLSIPNTSIPRIQINGEQANPDFSEHCSSSTSSPRSIGQARGVHRDQHRPGVSFRQQIGEDAYFPEQQLSPFSPYEPLFNHEYRGQNPPISPAISTASSGYASASVLGTDQPPDSNGFANDGYTSDQSSWQMIPHTGLGISGTLFGSSTSGSVDSDAFFMPELDQTEGQLKEDRIASLENQVRNLTQEVKDLQETLRKQHRVIAYQQEVIQLPHPMHDVMQGKKSKKRRLPTQQHMNEISDAFNIGEVDAVECVKKRGKFAPARRAQTAVTRQQGACIRCRRNKTRCNVSTDADERCESCRESNPNLHQLPCIRTRIMELIIFRCGTAETYTWTRRDDVETPMDLATYISEERKCLRLSQGFGPELEVKVRPYRPVQGDVLHYRWKDGLGMTRQKIMPPYALSDFSELVPAIQSYIEAHQDAYIHQFVQESDVPTWEAFCIARKLAASGKSPLLSDTLKLWTAARLIEKPWRICGEEKLGLQTDSHWWWTPVTPIMDTQLDRVVMRSFLERLKKRVLQQLQDKLEKQYKDSFLEIFTAVVILLNTVEEATRHDHEFTSFFGYEYSPGKRRFGDYELIESYFHAALVLLTHIKVIYEDRLPCLDVNPGISKLMKACQDEEEKNYMVKVYDYVNESKQRMNFNKVRNRHEYEKSQFWTHQLFLHQWSGSPITIQEK